MYYRGNARREDFARFVIQNLFGEDAAVGDLLLLKPRFDDVHAEALNRISGLVGFESTVFKTIYTNDELFSDFIRMFSECAIRSQASADDALESIYIWLMLEYLEHILPITETKLNFMKNSNWFSAPSSPGPATAGVSSPRKLLRPEVLAASYSHLEHLAMRSSSMRSLYPRLLQFVGNLIKHLSSMNTWPSIAQIEVLKVVVDHYHEFILSDTDDPDFASLKLAMAQKPLFIHPLQTFLERSLTNWSLESNYKRLIELWMSLTHHHCLAKCNEQKASVFMQASTQYFVGLFEVVVLRVLESDCVTLLKSCLLDVLEVNIFSNVHFLRLFRSYGLPTEDRTKMYSGAQGQADESILARIAFFLFSLSEVPKVSPELVERHIKELNQLLCNISQANLSDTRLDDSAVASPSRNYSHLSAEYSSNESRSISLLQPGLPDHQADPWTKMLYLTPQGRMQVLNREARFDYQKCSKQIAQTFPTVSRWEIGSLVKWLHLLSVRWTNCRLVRYLRQHSQDSTVVRQAAKLLLNASSPPKYVPVFSKFVPRHPARLNLRPFASIPVLIASIILLYLLLSFFGRIVFG
uniref:Sphingomyelin phosphodiesterase 4 n=1 Tax=Ditylenchus dipsaci TaxID=166011 RepID=A0A915DMR7_9BILA